jgi:AMMECR1 domain-containing protein
MMGNDKRTQDNAAAVAQRSEQAAQRDEVFKAMQRAEEERIEAKTMQLRALRMAKESPEPSGQR